MPFPIEEWNVLVVDDEQSIGVLAKRIFERNGVAKATVVFDGKEGLDIVRQEKPTFVLLDLDMPGVSGFDFCKTIKSDPQVSHIPLIAYTARAMPDQYAKLRGIGFAGFILKPFDFNTFIDDVAAILDSVSVDL